MFSTKNCWLTILGMLGILSVCSMSIAEDSKNNAKNAIDYSDAGSWLCRPEKNEICSSIKQVSVVTPDGNVSLQQYEPNQETQIDCFYVYPTSSEDKTANSDMQPGLEIPVTANQFGLFGSKCRQFAPLYRSITVRALRGLLIGRPLPNTNYDLPYQDVLSAWHYYLEHYNQGRGVVIIGHSQGSTILSNLIKEEIDGKPIQQQLVAVILAGTTVLVPEGKVVGGTFKSIPLCTNFDQAGCLIVYASYRATLPPSINPPARFGHASDSMQAACVNPAALSKKDIGSKDKVLLDSYFVTGDTVWTTSNHIETPQVRVPGLVSGQCVTRGEHAYLEISVNADASDPRTDTIPGDLIINDEPDPIWGLHRVDLALTMGNLLDVVDHLGQAWLKQRPSTRKKSKH